MGSGSQLREPMARLVLAGWLLFVTLRPAWSQLAIPDDMECQRGPHAAVWQSVKKSFRALLEETPGAVFNPIPAEKVKDAVDKGIAQVKAAGGFDNLSANECGPGKIAIQLLSVCLISDPMGVAQTVQTAGEAFASPLLTVLLDIPWVATALSGWPIFGIMAQLSLRKAELLKDLVSQDSIDGLENKISAAYFKSMRAAMASNDLAAMADATLKYLEDPTPGETDVLAALTALATQASVQSNVQERLNLVNGLQEAIKKAIRTPADLDLMLATRWPLWSLIHFTVDAITPAA